MSGGAWWCLTSGIVDTGSPRAIEASWFTWVPCISLEVAGAGSGTLLGPEGSAVQSSLLVGLLFLPLLEATCWWLRVLVGLLFEICIVDASIFVMRPVGRLGWFGCVASV